MTFNPRLNNKSMKIAQSDTRNVIQRSETFLNKKATKLANAMKAEMHECTFKPRVGSPQPRKSEHATGDPANKGVVERLYAYLDYYEKRKENYKNMLDDK